MLQFLPDFETKNSISLHFRSSELFQIWFWAILCWRNFDFGPNLTVQNFHSRKNWYVQKLKLDRMIIHFWGTVHIKIVLGYGGGGNSSYASMRRINWCMFLLGFVLLPLKIPNIWKMDLVVFISEEAFPQRIFPFSAFL